MIDTCPTRISAPGSKSKSGGDSVIIERGSLRVLPSSVAPPVLATPAVHASERPSATSGAGRAIPNLISERNTPSAPARMTRPRQHRARQASSWAAGSSQRTAASHRRQPVSFDPEVLSICKTSTLDLNCAALRPFITAAATSSARVFLFTIQQLGCESRQRRAL